MMNRILWVPIWAGRLRERRKDEIMYVDEGMKNARVRESSYLHMR